MFEMPSPYNRPFFTNACGWKPGTSFNHGSRPEYEVSMWPLNISVFPPPLPAQVPSAFARPSSTCCHCTCRPSSSKSETISSAIGCSLPVKLWTSIIALAVSISLSFRIFNCVSASPSSLRPHVREHALAEQADLLVTVLAPQLEHHMGATCVLVLLDCGDAVLRRAGDRLALVEDRVGHQRLCRKATAA